jgi:DNA-binding NarL/FixJ family response regulator
MRILIVEDDDDLRAEIVEYLKRRRHELMPCASLAAARETLQAMAAGSERPQAVICDMGLPDGDGADLYDDFAAGVGDCLWILMSGGHDPDRLERVRQPEGTPAPLIVDKPVSLKVLNQYLETAGGPASAR